MTARTIVLLALASLAPAGAARASAGHAHGDHDHAAPFAQRGPLAEARAELLRARKSAPPPPLGVTDLDFATFFGPVGDRGLTYSGRLRALAGKPVRILGYMVRQDQPVPGVLLLAPFPFQLHESEYGLAEDLPATLVHVTVPDQETAIVPFTPGLLLLTGELGIGPREEPDGRISTVRLRMHSPPAAPLHAASSNPEEKVNR
jgi:hypothetical protein